MDSAGYMSGKHCCMYDGCTKLKRSFYARIKAVFKSTILKHKNVRNIFFYIKLTIIYYECCDLCDCPPWSS